MYFVLTSWNVRMNVQCQKIFLPCPTVKSHDWPVFQQPSLLCVFKDRNEGLEAVSCDLPLITV